MKKTKFKTVAWEIMKLVIPAFLGFLLASANFSKQFDANEKGRLNDNLNKILDINFQYPFVDDSTYIARWNRDKNSHSDSSIRYQAYCEYVFNFLQNLCEYFKYDKKDMENFIDVENLIIQHKEWWKSPEQNNSSSYPKQFAAFVDQYYE